MLPIGCIYRLTAILLCLLFPPMVSADDVEPIRIGMSASLTGPLAPMGKMYVKGVRLWEEAVNAKSGILGRPVQVIIHDDGGSPEEAYRIYKGMIEEKQVDLVLGPYSSAISARIVPIVEQYHYPTLLPVAAADAIWANHPKYVFGMNTSAQRWTSAILAYLALQQIKKIGLLVNDRLFVMGVPREMDTWTQRLSMKLVLREMLDLEKISGQIRKARDSDVQALIVWGYLHDAVMVRKTLDKIGWYPLVYFAQIAPALPEYHRILGPLADLSVGTSVWEPSRADLYPGGKQFLDTFTAKHGVSPSYHAAMGFAAGQVLSQALFQAGTTDREAVRRKLAHLDTITIVGRYGVDSQGMQVRHHPLIIQWQDGKKKVISPESMSNSELRFKSRERPWP
jgi:branched-chain amino acid transport system substrate-binding protein